MGKINTKNVTVGGGGKLPMNFIPGNHICKINSIKLDRPPFAKTGEEMYNIIMNLETKPLGNGFEGFYIDKDDESKGRYEGQVGRVKSNPFVYKDHTTASGQTYKMVDNIIKFLKELCIALDSDWMEKANDKYDTIEDLVEGFNNKAPFKDVYLSWCIGGTQDVNPAGYPVYYMNLPKFEKGYQLVGSEDSENILPFNKTLHVYVKNEQTAPVKEFGSDNDIDSEIEEDDDAIFQIDDI